MSYEVETGASVDVEAVLNHNETTRSSSDYFLRDTNKPDFKLTVPKAVTDAGVTASPLATAGFERPVTLERVGPLRKMTWNAKTTFTVPANYLDFEHPNPIEGQIVASKKPEEGSGGIKKAIHTFNILVYKIVAPSTTITSRYGFNDGLSAPGPTGVKWSYEDAYVAVDAETSINSIFATEGVSGSEITREGIGQYYQESPNNWRVDYRAAISFHNYRFPTATGIFNVIDINIELANTSAGKVVIVPTTSTTPISLDAALASSDVRIFDVQEGRKTYSIPPLDMSAYTRLRVYPVFATTRAEWTTGPLKEAPTRNELFNMARTIRINPSDTTIVLRYQ